MKLGSLKTMRMVLDTFQAFLTIFEASFGRNFDQNQQKCLNLGISKRIFWSNFEDFGKNNLFDEVSTQTTMVLDQVGVAGNNENVFGYIFGIFGHF